MTLPNTTPGQANEGLSGRVVNGGGPREGYLPEHRDIRNSPGPRLPQTTHPP